MPSSMDRDAFQAWEQRLPSIIKDRSSVEEVGQVLATDIYDTFRDSVVLARFFATIPLRKLPEENRRFASDLAAARNASGQLREETLVLSLLGTAGDKPEWNDRRSSVGHVGIPLISSDFIETIPMIARLLKDMGVSLSGMSGSAPGIETRTFGKLGGLFYVEDAGTAVDQSGRKIISAQDFVEEHGIKTVFGTAGLFFMAKMFVTLIVFTRHTISRDMARNFMPIGGVVTALTSGLVNRGMLFRR